MPLTHKLKHANARSPKRATTAATALAAEQAASGKRIPLVASTQCEASSSRLVNALKLLMTFAY